MIKSVTDLGAAAYLLMHKYEVSGKKGKVVNFEIDNNPETEREFDRLYKEYIFSEFHRFDACLMSLKKFGEYTPMQQ